MEIGSITTILDRPGPYASVYVDVSRDTTDAEKKIELRSRAAGEDLVAHGCPEPLADLVVERLREQTGVSGAASRMVVGAGDAILLDAVTPRTGGADVITWGPLPDVTAWIADQDAMPGPVLQVLADREGADLTLFKNWPGPAIAEEHVHGDTLHITKVAVGDWAHLNYQRRSENVWRRNAEDVAEEISAMVDRGVTWVALAGDLRAVGDIRDAVDDPIRSLLIELETGGRAAGSSAEALDEAMDRAALEVVARRRAALADELAEQMEHGGVATGVDAVLDALVQGQARTVVVEPPTLREHEVRLRDHPGVPAPSGLADHDAPIPADLLVVSQAARTDADVVVPSDLRSLSADEPGPQLRDGVAAILRWSTTG